MTRQKVLIANRGEIAVRIAQTVRCLGLSPVAVYSEADRDALHVRACDEAYFIGPPQAAQSYLNMDVLLDVARRAAVHMVHPGYGFLSENATFATRVREAGHLFVGPPSEAMRVMGDKTRARQAMQAAGVPTVPGSPGALGSGPEAESAAQALAASMGYPVMLKASAGGGGKGMRVVHAADALPQALRAAASEAHNAFGDSAVYMEKALIAPRHIEIQIFCDAAGEAFFVGERECSLQRRHQKVIEETPSPLCDASLRRRMGEVACLAAKAVQYRGAGTVEFLVDAQRNFYFLEMNTRLQVEHAVTELCYGLDLVAAQIAVAQGEALGWKQDDLVPRGHAIEARLYAEDPSKNFMPSPGKITHVCWPTGFGVRVDAGVDAGYEVPRYYDPMIAKIIAWAPSRDLARARLGLALQQTQVHGITYNGAFLQAVLQHETFATGAYSTASLMEMLNEPLFLQQKRQVTDLDPLIAAAAIAMFEAKSISEKAVPPATQSNAWRDVVWRLQGTR